MGEPEVIDVGELELHGATQVVIDVGPHAIVRMRIEDGVRDGWHVLDTSRRYTHEIAANLTLENALRYARQHHDAVEARASHRARDGEL